MITNLERYTVRAREIVDGFVYDELEREVIR